MPSEKSIEEYKRIIQRIKTKETDFKNVEKIRKIIEYKQDGTPYARSSSKLMLCAVMYHLKENNINIPEYTDLYNKYKQEIVPEHDKDDEFVEWSVLSLLYKDVKNIKDKVILALYTLFPPRRNDYTNMLVVDTFDKTKADTQNYLVVLGDTMFFVFNEYKTAKTYGSQTFSVPKELDAILRPYARVGSPLFDMTDKYFSEYLARLTFSCVEKRVSINGFRHSFISHFLSGKPTPQERQSISNMMSHSLITQILYERH